MASPVTFPKVPEPIDDTIEQPKDKFWRKMREEPLIPIGSLLTCGALIVASIQLRKGNKEQFNKALRWRVAFQGLTVAAAVAGSFYYGSKALPPKPIPNPNSNPSDPSISDYITPKPANVTTIPGRPATVLQQSGAENRKREDSILFRRRVEEAEEKDRREKELVEMALMGENDSKSKNTSQNRVGGSGSLFKSWFGSGNENGNAEESVKRDSKGRPVIGQDSRRS